MIWVKGQSLIPRGAIFDAFQCIKDSIFRIKSEFPNTGILSKKNQTTNSQKKNTCPKKNMSSFNLILHFFHKKKKLWVLGLPSVNVDLVPMAPPTVWSLLRHCGCEREPQKKISMTICQKPKNVTKNVTKMRISGKVYQSAFVLSLVSQ